MKQENHSLTYMQVVVTLISMMIGVRYLTFPRNVTETVQTPDGWISSLLNVGLSVIAAAVVGMLARTFPGKSYFDYVPEIIGRVPGYIVCSGYVAYLLLFVAHEMRVLGEVVRFYLLSETPIGISLFLLLMAAVYLLLGGVRPVVRIQELFTPIILFLLLIMFILAIPTVELKNLEPTLSRGIGPIIKGLPEPAFAQLGFALITIFAAYMKRPQEAMKATITAVVIVGVINTITMLLTLGVFGVDSLSSIMFPVLEMVKSIEMPGGFVERLESIFLTIFIMTIFSTISIGLFACVHGVEKLYKTKRATAAIFLVSMSMLLALAPKDLTQTFVMGDFIENVGVFYVGVVPAILLQIAKARNMGNRNVTEDTSGDKGEAAAS